MHSNQSNLLHEWQASYRSLKPISVFHAFIFEKKKSHTVLMSVFERGIEEKEKNRDMEHKAFLRICLVFKRILDYVKRHCLNTFDICSIAFSISRLYC